MSKQSIEEATRLQQQSEQIRALKLYCIRLKLVSNVEFTVPMLFCSVMAANMEDVN